MEGLGFDSWQGQEISLMFRPAVGDLPFSVCQGSFPGVKRPGHEVDDW